MKKIEIKQTKITENLLKFQGDKDKELDYKDLIEVALDVVPQGGYTPKDIRERNRIQEALDKSTNVIEIEDADYDSLEKIVKDSRWSVRSPELNKFLQNFQDGIYKKDKEEPKEKDKGKK